MPAVRRSEERKFYNALCKFFKRIIDDTKTGGGILKGISPADRMFMQSDQTKGFLNNLVSKMVQTVRKFSANSWREAAHKGSRGAEIHRILRNEMQGPVGAKVWQIVEENSAYIRTLPEEWAKYASQYAYRETLKGKRPEEVEKELREIIPKHMVKNLKCIARTECAKANAAIVEARAEACGIQAYIWRSVKDERSRDSHKRMDGILVFYNDPPNPEALFGDKNPYGNYHAGNTFNCRCFQEPVVDVDFLPDSIRVHDHGEIRTMSKKQIIDKYGNIAG